MCGPSLGPHGGPHDKKVLIWATCQEKQKRKRKCRREKLKWGWGVSLSYCVCEIKKPVFQWSWSKGPLVLRTRQSG